MSDKKVLIDDWRQVWRYYSTWALALLALAPDIYTALVSLNLLGGDAMPAAAAWLVRGLAIAGVLARFVNQSKPRGLPPQVDS
ncbi:MAG TPA: hypothetical protein VIG97_03415 [Luteimonas sp.]